MKMKLIAYRRSASPTAEPQSKRRPPVEISPAWGSLERVSGSRTPSPSHEMQISPTSPNSPGSPGDRTVLGTGSFMIVTRRDPNTVLKSPNLEGDALKRRGKKDSAVIQERKINDLVSHAYNLQNLLDKTDIQFSRILNTEEEVRKNGNFVFQFVEKRDLLSTKNSAEQSEIVFKMYMKLINSWATTTPFICDIKPENIAVNAQYPNGLLIDIIDGHDPMKGSEGTLWGYLKMSLNKHVTNRVLTTAQRAELLEKAKANGVNPSSSDW